MKYDHYLIQQPKKWEQTWVCRPRLHERYHFPLQLKMAGYGQWFAEESYRRELSSDFFVEYVRKGNVKLVQDGKESLIQPGEVYLLRKGVAHYYTSGPAGFVLKRFLQIAGTGIDHYLQALGLWNRDHVQVYHPQQFERLLKQVTSLLANSPQEPDLSVDIHLSCLMYQILLELSFSIQAAIPPLIEKALTFMHENLHQTLSRQEICEHVGLSLPYFNRLFSSYMHCTPISYFLNQKFNWAAQLLKTTSLTVKEVSYKTGFDDPLYFSAQFKKRFGISPKHYRQHEEQRSNRERQRHYHPCRGF